MEELLSACVAMETVAAETYRRFGELALDPEEGLFWRRMACQEGEHVAFWRRLLELTDERSMPGMDAGPDGALEQVRATLARMREIGRPKSDETRVSSRFFTALQLEFLLLKPLFEELFAFGELVFGTTSPAGEYDDHLSLFLENMPRFGAASPELVVIGETVLALWQRTRALAQTSRNDALTGVLNRRGLFEAMHTLTHVAQRNDLDVGILLLDVDDFKRVNDAHGHQMGDEVLKQVASVVKAELRGSDLVGRYGGEEFLVFLPGTASDRVGSVGEKVRAAVEAGTRRLLPVTVSVGAATGRAAGAPVQLVDALVARADKNLYEAKRGGKNRVVGEPEPGCEDSSG